MFAKLFGKSTGPSIQNVVDALVQELLRRYPPSMASGEGRRLSPQAVTNILEQVINKAVVKATELQLGWFGKAKLANSFRWSLKDRGYPEKFIEVLTEALIVYVTRQQKP
ncbi:MULTISPECIES: hypothetical protein [Giesbergeria]|uniref:Uncharacterized protein n=1 Tax=Giesbergeria sinuosa TaxID=80883 RepID=A0ABV9QFW9_9BURK